MYRLSLSVRRQRERQAWGKAQSMALAQDTALLVVLAMGTDRHQSARRQNMRHRR
jgi:hypothetical protein